MLCGLFQDGFERLDVPLPGMSYLSFSNFADIEHDDDCNDVPIIYEPAEDDSLYYQVRYNDKYYYVTESHNKVIQYLIPYPNR